MSIASPPVAPPFPRADRWTRPLVWFTTATVATAAAMLLLLHLVPGWGGRLNPVTAMLSEYAYAPGRWLWDLALALTSVGSVALAFALRRAGILRGIIASVSLGAWCVSILSVALFTKDPQGGAVSFTGKLHLYATGIACATLPLAGLALARRHRTHLHWRPFAGWTRRLSLASIPFFLPFIVPFAVNVAAGANVFPTVATGLIERLMSALELILLAVLAGWARRASVQSEA